MSFPCQRYGTLGGVPLARKNVNSFTTKLLLLWSILSIAQLNDIDHEAKLCW